MRKLILVLATSSVLGACSSMPEDVFTGSRDCGYIGCESGGLRVYQHEKYGATEQPRRWYKWDWGKSHTAYYPGTPEYEAALAEECRIANSYGLDCMGRPLNEN
jgi:hypothetical protein